MFFLVVFLACLFVTIGTGILAGWSDFRGLTIPNLYSGLILGAFALAWGVGQVAAPPDASPFSAIGSHLFAGFLMFLVTYGMFAAGMIGAADSKIGTAFALWLGVRGLLPFLFFMTVAGGILGVAALALRRKPVWKNAPEGCWIDRVQKGENAVPYGIAIALGAFVAMLKVGYFSLGTWASLVAPS